MSSGNKKGKFLIYSISRSGSSNFEHSLRSLINQGKTLGEFFGQQEVKREVLESGESFDERKNKIFELLEERHNSGCIGHKFNRGNLSYIAKSWDIRKELFSYYNKIIFLFRHNLLKAKISSIISSKTGVYNLGHEDEGRESILKHGKFKVDIEYLRNELKSIRQYYNNSVLLLEECNTPCLTLTYESLYGVKDVNIRRLEVERVIKWLGYKVDYTEKYQAERLLHPDKKLNNYETYNIIENIDEINSELGDKYGYLY